MCGDRDIICCCCCCCWQGTGAKERAKETGQGGKQGRGKARGMQCTGSLYIFYRFSPLLGTHKDHSPNHTLVLRFSHNSQRLLKQCWGAHAQGLHPPATNYPFSTLHFFQRGRKAKILKCFRKVSKAILCCGFCLTGDCEVLQGEETGAVKLEEGEEFRELSLLDFTIWHFF